MKSARSARGATNRRAATLTECGDREHLDLTLPLLEKAEKSRARGRISEALKYYGAALRKSRHCQKAIIGSAICHEVRGDARKARKLFEQAKSISTLPVEDYLTISVMLYESGEFDVAKQWLMDALYHFPRNEEVHLALRLVSERQTRYVEAKKSLLYEISVNHRDLGFIDFVAAHGDSRLYLSQNPDVANADLGAFYHWLNFGLREGRRFPGVEVRRRKARVDVGHPWRSFFFRGQKLFSRIARPASNHLSYETVLRAWEFQKLRQAKNMSEFCSGARHLPLISIVVPVYNADPALLRATIESVRSQKYSKWQLCLADDCSPSPGVRQVLEEYTSVDKRIHVVFRRQNGGISAATNSALELANGSYVAFLDHDDVLDDCALLCVAKLIEQSPGAKIIYTDEDKISVAGARFGPHFKPDWNRELFYGMNYLCHFTVIKSEVLKKAGPMRSEFNGAQDYDILLRCIEIVVDHEIHHIPKVLYSWRASEGSTALDPNSKLYAWEAGRRALADHLRRTRDPYSIVERGPFSFTYQPNWSWDSSQLISIIIPTRDKLDLLRTAVEGILSKTTKCRFEVVVIDNQSVDEATHAWFKEIVGLDSRVRVLPYNRPFNYSAINNYAVTESRGNILVFVNNDVEVRHPEWLLELCMLASRSDVGCVGAKLLYPNCTLQHAGVVIGAGGVAGHVCHGMPEDSPGHFGRLKLRQEFSAVTAACMAVRREVFHEVRGFNEGDLAVAFNDVDLCLRIRDRGYRNIWTPLSVLIHHESVSRGRDDTPQKRERFLKEVRYMLRRWKTNVYADPAYNPNLSLAAADFSFGTPVWNF